MNKKKDEKNENKENEIKINNVNEQISENIQKEINIIDTDKVKDNEQEKEINTLDLDNLDINIEEIENNEKVIDTNVNKVNILNEKSKKELMEIAENNELSKTGTKSELINRIVESEIELN